jgi:hypothetical protein
VIKYIRGGFSVLKLIIDFIKDKNKSIAYCIFFIAIICFFSVKNWGVVEETYHTTYILLTNLLHHIISVIFILTILVGTKFILNYSNKKSLEDINDYYEQEIILESEYNKYISIELKENIETLNERYGKKLEVIIKNTSNLTIDYIKGNVFLYDSRKNRIKSVEFETKNLRKSYSDRIFCDLLDGKERIWSEFDSHIIELKAGDEVQQNFFIEGRRVIRTYSIILNYSKFYDYKILGIRTKYNLVWLKNKIKRELIPAVKFFCSKKVLYMDKHHLYTELNDLIIRLIRCLLVLLTAVLIVALMIAILIDIQKMFVSMFGIFKDYFQHVAKLV